MQPQEREMVGGSGATVLVGHLVADEERAYGEPRRIACDTCEARGWLPSEDLTFETGWPRKCFFCSGKGSMSLHAIATALDEDPGVLYRLSESRVRPKTASRLLDKLILLLSGEILLTDKQEAHIAAVAAGRGLYNG